MGGFSIYLCLLTPALFAALRRPSLLAILAMIAFATFSIGLDLAGRPIEQTAGQVNDSGLGVLAKALTGAATSASAQ